MAMWLFKQEPNCYSFADLQKDGSTTWDGVANGSRKNTCRNVKKGDRVFFYHSGDDRP